MFRHNQPEMPCWKAGGVFDRSMLFVTDKAIGGHQIERFQCSFKH